jgi:acyl-CoA thioester hydrolase
VRFAEIDALGHVNNTAYMTWFESFRLPYLRHQAGRRRLPGRDVQRNGLRGDGPHARAAHHVLHDGLRRLASRSAGAMCTATGEAIVVLLNRDAPGRYPIPEAGRTAFIEIDGAVQEAT